jgi:hypothetical protein
MARLTGTLSLDDGSVENRHISNSATSKVDADKLQHIHKPGTAFGTAIGGTPATREEVVFVASTAGTIREFHCLLSETGTNTSVSFDLKKNGVSVLSSAVTITHSDGDREVKDGTISTPTIAADDVLSIAMTVSSSTGAQGPFAWVVVEELAG